MRRRAIAAQAAALITLTALTGCFAAGGDKSGGSVSPHELVLANNDGNLEGVPSVARFVQRAEALSGGQLTVRVESRWRGGEDEPQVIEDVAAGRADLGWSGTRAFDLVGVAAFRPLHAPFLVGTYAAQAAVVSDHALMGELLGSFEPLGLSGLAVAADEIRFPAATTHPLRTPADFAGLRFATVASDIQAEGLRALGAQPTTAELTEQGLTSGQLDGIETMWWTYNVHSYYTAAPFATANAGLWPRTLALFANTKTLEGLSEQERSWIEEAAEDAAAWSVEHAAEAEREPMAHACQSGARVVTATPEQLSALRQAAEPVYTSMRKDPAQGPILEKVEALASNAPPDPPLAVPEGCAYQPGDEKAIPAPVQPLSGPGDPGGLPEGIYRLEHTPAELTAHGETEESVRNNAGVITWTLRDGRWSNHPDPTYPNRFSTIDCAGFYDVSRDVATFTTTTVVAGGTCAPPSWTARWSIDGDTLRWSAVSGDEFAYVFGGEGWTKID
jgi:TRAP-type C4-dicarboxylate transport system substrate-binding protein